MNNCIPTIVINGHEYTAQTSFPKELDLNEIITEVLNTIFSPGNEQSSSFIADFNSAIENKNELSISYDDISNSFDITRIPGNI